MREVQRRLAKRERPFVTLAQVEEWRKQYALGTPDYHRYMILVLKGPSQYGKTSFAQSLFGKQYTHVVNCENVVEPCLSRFKSNVHQCIVFDECPYSLVVGNKAIFQANALGVTVQQSRCNAHAKWVNLHRIALIVSTNSWPVTEEARAELTEDQRDWLDRNVVLVEVTDFLYVAGTGGA